MRYLRRFRTPAAVGSGVTVDLPNVSYLDDSNVVYSQGFESTAIINYDSGTGKIYRDYSQEYLTFEVIQSGTFKFSGATTAHTLSYSLDGGTTWTSLAHNTDTPRIAAGSKIMWEGNLAPISYLGIGTFSATGKFNAYGNALSLIYGDYFAGETDFAGKSYAFSRLFYNNAKIVNAQNLILPATTLPSYCYQYMFQNCTSLTIAPALPATTLASYCYSWMFQNCTSLTTAPALPATTLAEGCYVSMFQGCTSLTTAPELPATTLARDCYGSMFYGCTSLTTAPALPATTLAGYCYGSMFVNCTSLTTAPELPATTLASNCYSSMFRDCSSLTTAPELPATTLLSDCYSSMFAACESLTTAPALPATTLAERCYGYMFYRCTSLTIAPELPATTLAGECYSYMFQGCTKLNCIKAMFLTTPSSTYTSNWVSGVSPAGVFIKNTEATWDVVGNNGVPSGWVINKPIIWSQSSQTIGFNESSECYPYVINPFNLSLTYSSSNNSVATIDNNGNITLISEGNVSFTATFGGNQEFPPYSITTHAEVVDYSKKYLTFEATQSGTFKFSNAITYSIDNGTSWVNLAANTNTPTIAAGSKIMWKGTLTPNSSSGIGTFNATGKFNACGNIMSLLYGDNFIGQTDLTGKSYAFYRLFANNATIVNAQSLILPATTLAYSCYGNMFFFCTSLTTAPELPATTLAERCYYYMFYVCGSLTTAPELPATTLASYCYGNMFFFCTSLTTAPALPATTLADHCYGGMFNGCSSLTTAPGLPATTLASNCYDSMFYGCKSLTTAPGLSATTLANYCYYNMFNGCSSLTTAPGLPATTLASNCYGGMFFGCTSLTTAPELLATTLASSCYQNMFYNCTSLTTAPELPATTLATECYYNMFYGCTRLTTAPALPATTLVSNCYRNMFQGCSSLTTAPALPATTLAGGCYSYMFYGCTSLTTAPELPATILAQSCYWGMFNGCTSLSYLKMLCGNNNEATQMYDNSSKTGVLSIYDTGLASNDTFLNQFIGWELYLFDVYIGIIEAKGGGYYEYSYFEPTK